MEVIIDELEKQKKRIEKLEYEVNKLRQQMTKEC